MTDDNKIAALESLVNEMSVAMAELVEAAQNRGASASEMSNTLVEILGVMQSRKAAKEPDFQVIAEAIGKLRLTAEAPQVTVQNQVDVSPTPVENHITVQPAPIHLMPAERVLMDYEMTVEYDTQSRITKTLLTAIPRKK